MVSEAQIAFEKGKSLFEDKNYDEAVSAFAKAARLEPKNAEYHAWLAYAWYQEDEFDKAMQSANQAIKADPSCAPAYLYRGYVYASQGNFTSAFQDFSKAVQLVPDNWEALQARGRIYLQQKKATEAINDLSKSIHINPDAAQSYLFRGMAQGVINNHQAALEDFSQSIKLKPNNPDAFIMRALIYEELGDIENAIIDRVRAYEEHPKEQWTGQSLKFQPWYKAIHTHFTDVILPKAKSNNERFIEYWPCMFLWGRETKTNIQDGTSYDHTYGTYGTGYLCILERSVLIITFTSLTQQFPLYKYGFVGGFLAFTLGNTMRHEQPEKQDKILTLPFQSISGAQIEGDHINLVTPALKVEIYSHFTDNLTAIMTALNLVISGNMERIWGESETTSKSESTDIVELLKKLSDLKAAGVISEADFEQKKKELLARL